MTDSKVLSNTQENIKQVCKSLADLLLEKNRRYGDSAVNPHRIFSRLPAEEGILIRLDDKCSRIMNATELRKNDIADILGYLTLLCVSKGWTDFSELID